MLERTLARLRDSTHDLAPPAGLAARVAARVAEAPPISRPRLTAYAVIDLGRRALAVAAFAAAAALAFAWVGDRELDRAADALVDVAGFSP
jgi:hypothetical protein